MSEWPARALVFFKPRELARASRRLSGRDCFQALRETVNRANQKTHIWVYQTNEAHGYSGFGFTKIHLDESSAVVQPTESLEKMHDKVPPDRGVKREEIATTDR
jgi:hypothetical protein